MVISKHYSNLHTNNFIVTSKQNLNNLTILKIGLLFHTSIYPPNKPQNPFGGSLLSIVLEHMGLVLCFEYYKNG